MTAPREAPDDLQDAVVEVAEEMAARWILRECIADRLMALRLRVELILYRWNVK
jgi:hypothetical protein